MLGHPHCGQKQIPWPGPDEIRSRAVTTKLAPQQSHESVTRTSSWGTRRARRRIRVEGRSAKRAKRCIPRFHSSGFADMFHLASRLDRRSHPVTNDKAQCPAGRQRIRVEKKNSRPERSPEATNTGRLRACFGRLTRHGKAAGSVWRRIHSVCGAAGDTEAQVLVPVLRPVPVAVRRTAIAGVVVPAPAPDRPGQALWPLTIRQPSTWRGCPPVRADGTASSLPRPRS